MRMWQLIKWVVKSVLFIIGFLALNRYITESKKSNPVVFDGKKISDENFIVFNSSFSKDSTTVYYKSKVISGVEASSFSAIDDHYARDRNGVIYCDEYRDGKVYYLNKSQIVMAVSGADPDSFQTLDHGYAKDKDQAYFKGVPFGVKHVASLVSINSSFVKDNVYAYLNLRVVKDSHGSTFELMDDNFARDEKRIYHYAHASDGRYSIVPLQGDRDSFRP